MILSFLFFAFIAYLLFRLVVNFVIPVYKTTKKVKQAFHEMNSRMHAQTDAQQTQTEKNSGNHQKSTLGDYIDFEEVKE